MIKWVKGMMGAERHPLCRNGIVVAKVAAAKAAAEADKKPKDMTGEDKNKKDKHDSKDTEQEHKKTVLR